MKKILLSCACIVVVGVAYLIWSFLRPEHFGSDFTTAPLVQIADLDEHLHFKQVRVEGKIVRQCPVTGCWFYLEDKQGRQVRIDFEASIPRLPQRIGRMAIVEGELSHRNGERIIIGSAVEFR